MFMSAPALAQDPGLARPNLLLRESVTGMPRGDRQELRVLSASFKPGDKAEGGPAQPVRKPCAGAPGRSLPTRSYSEITCAPSNSRVAAISRLSRTTIAVVSEP
jgi:hypothetical protein